MAPRRPVPPGGPAGRRPAPARTTGPRTPARGTPARPPSSRAASSRSTPVRESRPAPAAGDAEARPPRAARPKGVAGRPAGRGLRRPPVVRPVTMLSGVLVILALLIAPYVRPWLAQRSQLTQGRAEVVQLQSEVARLQAERNRWNDPAYIRAQARARLGMLNPGEVGYVRLDPAAPTTRRTRAARRPRSAPARHAPGTARSGSRSSAPARRHRSRRARRDREGPPCRDIRVGRAGRSRTTSGGAGPARAARARDGGGRAPVPVRPAGRRHDPPPARGRHPVPDDLLPHLSARDRRRRDAGVGRCDAGDDRADPPGRRPRRALRARPRGLPAPRAALGEVPEIAGVSAGGMPDRVKCLHVLVAHSLAAGPGVNPLGDEALAALPAWWPPVVRGRACPRTPQDRATREATHE